MSKSLAFSFGVVILVFVGWYVFLKPPTSLPPVDFPIQSPEIVPQPTIESDLYPQVTLTGEGICLPHKNTDGPQTMECAFGLQATDGFNYALSLSEGVSPTFETGKTITVTGLVMPVEALSSDHWQKYDIKGVMQVESLLEN